MNWNFITKKKTKPAVKKSKTREWIDAIVFAVVAATIIRGLLFSAYAIPSGSMEGTELTGDYLFVSKISYGPRMPFTPISIPFTEPTISLLNNMKSYWSGWQLGYHRLPGFTSVKKGDIVVFNKPSETGTPIDMRTTLIKRCQATPGDVLTIVNAQVYINGKAAPNAPKAQTSYTVVTDGQQLNPQIFQDLVINQMSPTTYEMIIPVDETATIKSYSNIKSITPYVAPAGTYNAEIFPNNPQFKWNQDNFGPLVIPKKGMTISLNDSTIILYNRAIEQYEGNRLGRQGNKITLNGKPANTYTFKMDYYWMMGDNRHNSLDCRFWGYVPEDHIVGKAIITFFSKDPTKDIFHAIRWNRILKPIN